MAQATLKEPETTQAAPFTDQDVEAVFDRLEEFRETLPEREKQILSRMIVEAGGDDEATQEGISADATDTPKDEDLDSLGEKLHKLHEELPGNQHLVLDSLVAKSLLKEAVDTEGYHYLFIRTVPNRRVRAWARYCASIGGDQLRYVGYRGGGHKTIGCWEADY